MIDNESRKLLAVHHTGFIVAEAGQIYRGYTNSDHGIDGEVAQIRSPKVEIRKKSEARSSKPESRDVEEHFRYSDFGFPSGFGIRCSDFSLRLPPAHAVMLGIRTSDGEIRWMDVSAYLKRESGGGKAVRQIVFAGERFDAVSVQNWRKKVLGQGLP